MTKKNQAELLKNLSTKILKQNHKKEPLTHAIKY